MRIAKRAALTFRRAAIGLVVVIFVFVSFGLVEAERNKDEEYAVYSAYLSDEILNNAHDWSVDGSVRVVVRDRTISAGVLRFQSFYSLDGRGNCECLNVLTRASYLARNLFHTSIQPKFALPGRAIVSVTSDSNYGSPEFERNFPNNMGFVALSGVGFNLSKSQAVFYIDHYCGLCGGGGYVLMQKFNGIWRIQGVHSTWIS